MEIVFIRHGQTDWNKLGKVQGRTDIELNEKGIDQARITADLIKDEKFDVIVSSPLKRVRQTVEIINEGRNLPVVFDNGVIERGFGVYEGVHWSAVDFGVFWDLETIVPIENGESLSDFLDRVKLFLERLKEQYEGKKVLIASHGGVSIAMQYIFNGLADDGYLPKGIKNCEVIKFNY